ncbi:ead/Ea22-like family protein [Enterobacter hormaechei]|uniref:ead/Ea22-like family protein n=1 Tax=Enterobacter hormaechei TaxID=158836 RepID=UPI0012511494|nr:ead/Ea22-like family protein [Enterobacter hormaechei]VAE12553.1 Uncharacterised protein [Enterobacter hormaechei]VAF53667.1 Uncharacterised protein [Enterobacter hormaechei]
MSNIDKRALREAAEKASTDNHNQDEWFHYLRCSTPETVLALLDELEAAEKRIADQRGIIASARKFISEYAGLGDVGAAEFIKIIDRAAAGKGEAS